MSDPIYSTPKAHLDINPELREILIAMPHAGPWRRFFARIIDLFLIGVIAVLLIGYLGSQLSPAFIVWINKPGSDSLFGIATLPVALLLEGFFYGIFGNTVGKKFLGLKVITVAGYPPTMGQYFSRQIGVYFAGLGLGIPLINLFTMARQSGRLRRGDQASYDQGAFNVKGEKLGGVRIASGFAAVFLIFGVAAASLIIKQKEEIALTMPTSWTNPYTGATVSIPAGWVHQTTENSDGQPLDIFSNDSLGSVAIFAGEEVGNVDMKTYLSALTSAVSTNLSLDNPSEAQFGKLHGVQLLGHRVTSKSEPVRMIVVQLGSVYFRLITISTSKRKPDSLDEKKLESNLLGSIQ